MKNFKKSIMIKVVACALIATTLAIPLNSVDTYAGSYYGAKHAYQMSKFIKATKFFRITPLGIFFTIITHHSTVS